MFRSKILKGEYYSLMFLVSWVDMDNCIFQGCRDLLRVILEKSLLIPGQNAAVMDQVDALMKASVTFL